MYLPHKLAGYNSGVDPPTTVHRSSPRHLICAEPVSPFEGERVHFYALYSEVCHLQQPVVGLTCPSESRMSTEIGPVNVPFSTRSFADVHVAVINRHLVVAIHPLAICMLIPIVTGHPH